MQSHCKLCAMLTLFLWIALLASLEPLLTSVFRNSDLWREVHRDRQAYFPGEEYIIGDKAYPVLSWCIPPFVDRGNLTRVSRFISICR